MSKKKLIIILAPVLLIALVAVKMVVLKPPPPDEAKLAKEPGPTYVMPQPFVVNLADTDDSPHFVKVGVALRLSKLSAPLLKVVEGPEPVAEVEDSAELRDIVISTLQRRTSRSLASPAGRDEVKTEIRERINADTELKIIDVYYTEFAVQ